MQVRRLRVQIDTPSLRVTGTLQLPTEGYRSRITDFINSQDTGFFALTDAELDDGRSVRPHPFVAVGARHIVTLVEIEDLGIIEDDQPAPIGMVASTPPPPSSG